MADTVLEADLPIKGRVYRLAPRMNYKYDDALNRVRQSVPINVTFAVQVDGANLGERFLTARVHPINDCPYAYQNPDDAKGLRGHRLDVRRLRERGSSRHPGPAQGSAGHRGGRRLRRLPEQRPRGRSCLQVFAVWEALRQHNIRYSDIGTTTDESTSLYTLHVRFIEEALAESHANCVDASALCWPPCCGAWASTRSSSWNPGTCSSAIYLDADGQAVGLSGDDDARRSRPGEVHREPRAGEVGDAGGQEAQGLALFQPGAGFRDARVQ